jgi:mono/diheme cytochrome c family protein
MRAWLFAPLFLMACSNAGPFMQPLKLHDKLDADGNDVKGSGETLSAELLNEGHSVFMRYCFACHGEKGDGNGPASLGMRPPPRNFALGQFKFTGSGYGDLPVDSALQRTIRRGLHGTPMAAWDLPPKQLLAVTAYLKALSPRWKEEGVKPQQQIAPDPWANKPKADAVALGRRVFHVAVGGAGCSGCHASFEPKAVLQDLHEQATGKRPESFPAGRYETSLKASAYPASEPLVRRASSCTAWLWNKPADLDGLTAQVNGQIVERDPAQKNGWDYVESPAPAAAGVQVPANALPTLQFFGTACDVLTKDSRASITSGQTLQLSPPSFLFHRLKTAWPVGTQVKDEQGKTVGYTEAMQREDLYRTIGAGIGGAAMPGWKGVLEEEQLWALVYYVQHLARKRGTVEALQMRATFDAD